MNTAKASFDLAGDIWSTGNWWARRLLIGAILWHLATLAVGLIGVPVITILFMITVGSALAILAIWYTQPLIPILAALTSGGQKAAHWVTGVICFELALGTYLATVPVGTNWTTRALALMAIGAAFTAVMIKISHHDWKTPLVILWLKFIVLTLVIYAYGWLPEIVSASKEGWGRWQTQTAERIRLGEINRPSEATLYDNRSQRGQFHKHGMETHKIYPDRDSDWIELPPYTNNVRIHSPGTWLLYRFGDGNSIKIDENGKMVMTHIDGTKKQISAMPDPFPTNLTIRGDGGIVTIKW